VTSELAEGIPTTDEDIEVDLDRLYAAVMDEE
jgi:hypothetical protein